jgi:hypothetical protein
MGATHGEKGREKQTADGIRWLLGAGFLAILLAYFAFSSDEFLSGGRERDRQHSDMLRELRIAQTTMKSGEIDPRLELRLLTSPEKAAPARAKTASDAHREKDHH